MPPRKSARTRRSAAIHQAVSTQAPAPTPTHVGFSSRSGLISSVGPTRNNKRTHSAATARPSRPTETVNIFPPPLQVPRDWDDVSDVSSSLLSPSDHTNPSSPGHKRPSSPYHSLSIHSIGYDTPTKIIVDDDSSSSDFSSAFSSPSLSHITFSNDTHPVPPFMLSKTHPESDFSSRFDHPESASWLKSNSKDELTLSSLFKPSPAPWMLFDEFQHDVNRAANHLFTDLTVCPAMTPDVSFLPTAADTFFNNNNNNNNNNNAIQMPRPLAINLFEIQPAIHVPSDDVKQQQQQQQHPAAFPLPPPLPPVHVEVTSGPRIAIAPVPSPAPSPSPSRPSLVHSFHARAEGDAEGFIRLENVPAHSIVHKDARASSNHLTFREESRKVVLHVIDQRAIDHLRNGGEFHIRARLPSGPLSRPAAAKLQNHHVVLYLPKVPVQMCPVVAVPGAESTCHEIEIVFGDYYFTFPATVRTRPSRPRNKKKAKTSTVRDQN